MLAIWLVYDLGEHANDFQEAHLGFEPIAQFYLVQIPFIIVNQLPMSVLLGLLYVLNAHVPPQRDRFDARCWSECSAGCFSR